MILKRRDADSTLAHARRGSVPRTRPCDADGNRFNKRHVPARHAEAVADVGLQPGQQSGRQGHIRVLMVVSIHPMAALN